jgi:hypothetical protein
LKTILLVIFTETLLTIKELDMLDDYVSKLDEKKWEYHPRVRIQKEASGEKSSSESGRVTSEMLERRNFRLNPQLVDEVRRARPLKELKDQGLI